MKREFHVRFCEGVGVQFPRATRLVVLCPKGSAERYMVELRKFLGRLKLLVNEEKTQLVSARTGFDFLGVTFRKQRIPSRPRVAMCYVWPSRRSMQRIRDKVRAVVADGLQSSLRMLLKKIVDQ